MQKLVFIKYVGPGRGVIFCFLITEFVVKEGGLCASILLQPSIITAPGRSSAPASLVTSVPCVRSECSASRSISCLLATPARSIQSTCPVLLSRQSRKPRMQDLERDCRSIQNFLHHPDTADSGFVPLKTDSPVIILYNGILPGTMYMPAHGHYP